MANNTITVNVSNDVNSVIVSDTGLRGRPGLVWRGEFSATANYYVGDAVSFEGTSYIVSAYSAASAATPDNSANFSVLAQGSITYVLPDSVVHDTETIDGGTY